MAIYFKAFDESGHVVLFAFIYLLLGYGFARYLIFVNWLSNRSSGAGYYEYYINGGRTGGGGPLSMFVFLFLYRIFEVGNRCTQFIVSYQEIGFDSGIKCFVLIGWSACEFHFAAGEFPQAGPGRRFGLYSHVCW